MMPSVVQNDGTDLTAGDSFPPIVVCHEHRSKLLAQSSHSILIHHHTRVECRYSEIDD